MANLDITHSTTTTTTTTTIASVATVEIETKFLP